MTNINDIQSHKDLYPVLANYRDNFFRYFEEAVSDAREKNEKVDVSAFVKKYSQQIFDKIEAGIGALKRLEPTKDVEQLDVETMFNEMITSYCEQNKNILPELVDVEKEWQKDFTEHIEARKESIDERANELKRAMK